MLCVCMGEGILDLFNSTIGVKQKCPRSLALFALYIDELEQTITKFVKEEGIKKLPLKT